MTEQSKMKAVGLFVLQRPMWLVRGYMIYRLYKFIQESRKQLRAQKQAKQAGLEDHSGKKRGKAEVDAIFFANLWKLIKIVIPGFSSKEFMMLVLHSGFLVLRTWLSVIVANLDGLLVKTLVTADGKGFIRGLGMWFGISIPATFTNSMIKYLQSSLALSFRTRLTRYVHDAYLDSKTYYKVGNLDSRLENPDQLITTDVTKFCDALAELYGNLGKPALDMYLFARELKTGVGASGMGTLWWAYYATALVLRVVTPPFGKLRAAEAKYEGDFRFAHSRIITNAEEIAFYGGEERERNIVDSRYLNLIKHTNVIFRTRIWFNMFEDLLIKYLWSTIGLLAQAFPVFYPEVVVAAVDVATNSNIDLADASAAARTEQYITNKRLMISLADAGGRIMYSYKDLTELSGFTSRVFEMLTVFEDMKREKFEKTMVSNDVSLKKLEGRVTVDSKLITLNGVPVISPNGELLCEDLYFTINHGDHLMVTGPNGCGKSSLVRIIAQLWPAFRGTLTKPVEKEMFYLPQRPYLSIGSLRDQVIYPDTKEQMIKKGYTDQDLLEILKAAHLSTIPEREGGWDTVKEWKDVFSGGEKQRFGMARLFYHKPKFAFLDECTSAVSTDVEGLMYAHAKELNISLVTVSHRPSLFKYHKFLLRFDGEQKWTFSQLDTNKELLSLADEMKQIEARLAEVPDIEARLQEIHSLLKI